MRKGSVREWNGWKSSEERCNSRMSSTGEWNDSREEKEVPVGRVMKKIGVVGSGMKINGTVDSVVRENGTVDSVVRENGTIGIVMKKIGTVGRVVKNN